MENVIIILVVAIIAALAVAYVYTTKKKGKKCIGCPYDGSCGGCCGKKDDK